jgi:hypothetical protein
MWMGQEQPDGTRQVVIAGIIEANRAPRSRPNELESELSEAMSQFKRGAGFIGFTNTSGERGQLAGKPFIRTQFSGMKQGLQLHGQLLLTIEGARLVTIARMSKDGPGTPGYQLLDAALLTFRQR